MESVFKSLRKMAIETEKTLEKCPCGSQTEIMFKDKKYLIESIETYLKSYEWLKQKNIKEKIQFYIDNGYDYDLFCEHFGIPYVAAKNTVYYASKQFKEKIGANTIALLKLDKIQEAKASFKVASGNIKVKEYLFEEFAQYLPQKKFGVYKLKDCKEELEILRVMSKVMADYHADIMDVNKMAFLVNLIEGKSRKADMLRPYLIGLMSYKYTADEVIEAEKNIDYENLYY
ncbi:MAG: hypothetical protein IKA31_05270 [Clostridia bacterium]|nr:hypothetical protein [Clostridia bacterium]